MLYTFFGSIPNKSYSDILSLYGNIQHNLIEIDRFGYMNKFSPWNLGSKDDWFSLQSDMPNTDEKFYDIFYDRIKDIISHNEKLYVSWSGGVDSSAIVCGLLSYGYKNFEILYTSESIEEFPLLYDILKKLNIHMIDLSDDINAIKYSSTINDGLLIMGWCADQLFGSIINQDYPDYFKKNYADWIKMYSDKEGIDYSIAIEQSNEAFKNYNIPIRTFPEWAWFLNFAVKWNYVKLSPFAAIGKYTDRVINFFDTIDFQKWSINNFDKLSLLAQTNPSEYKLPLKKIIEGYTHYPDYTKTKGKNGSWKYVVMKQKMIKIALIDDEGFKSFNPNFNVHQRRFLKVTERLVNEIAKQYLRNENERITI